MTGHSLKALSLRIHKIRPTRVSRANRSPGGPTVDTPALFPLSGLRMLNTEIELRIALQRATDLERTRARRRNSSSSHAISHASTATRGNDSESTRVACVLGTAETASSVSSQPPRD